MMPAGIDTDASYSLLCIGSGTAENKQLQDLLPGIINQLGSDNLEHLKTIAGQFGQVLSHSFPKHCFLNALIRGQAHILHSCNLPSQRC